METSVKKQNSVKTETMPSQNVNQFMLDFHMPAIQTPEECDHSTSENALNDAPGCLPNYGAINAPFTFVWGQHGDGVDNH